MGFNEWLERKNKNLEDMRTEIWMQAKGYNVMHTEKSWWERNYINVVWYGLLIISLPICYYLGFVWATRILFITLSLQAGFLLWRWIKKGYNTLKAYMKMRKLLKQIFHLKKD